MDRDLKKLLWVFAIILVFGGVGALWKVISALFAVLKAIWHVGKWEIIKGIVISPKTLTILIISLLTASGIWVSYKTKKRITWIISTILGVIDFILMFT